MQLALMVTTVGSITAAILKGSWGTSQAFFSNGSLCKQAVTPRKPGCGVTHWAISSTFVGDVGSDLVLCTFNSSACCCQTILSPELQLWGLHLEPREMGGICPAATTTLEGCNTFLHPGNQFGGCSILVGSLVTFTAASPIGELVCIGWALLGVGSSGCVVKGSSRRAMPLKMASSGKETLHFISSLSSNTLPTKRCGWPWAGRLAFSTQNWRAWA